MGYLNPESQDSVPVIDSFWKRQRTAGLSWNQEKTRQCTDRTCRLSYAYTTNR